MSWYVSQGGRASGPFPEKRLAMMVHWGKVGRDAYICDEQLTKWIALERSVFASLLTASPTPLSSRRSARSRMADLVASGVVAKRLGILALLVGALVMAIGLRAAG